MTKIKICGLKREEDIKYANEVKPDYIGFVFAGAKRKIDFVTAAKLKKLLDKDIKSVGVFVNEGIGNIARLCDEGTIDLVQLHGDEDEAYICKLKERVKNKIIKAVKIQSSKLEELKVQSSNADFILFDSGSGSGKIFDWNLIKGYDKPFFLAGGLNKDNLAKALKMLNPWCVDLSSGVETDGLKDFEKIKEVIKIVRRLED